MIEYIARAYNSISTGPIVYYFNILGIFLFGFGVIATALGLLFIIASLVIFNIDIWLNS